MRQLTNQELFRTMCPEKDGKVRCNIACESWRGADGDKFVSTAKPIYFGIEKMQVRSNSSGVVFFTPYGAPGNWWTCTLDGKPLKQIIQEEPDVHNPL